MVNTTNYNKQAQDALVEVQAILISIQSRQVHIQEIYNQAQLYASDLILNSIQQCIQSFNRSLQIVSNNISILNEISNSQTDDSSQILIILNQSKDEGANALSQLIQAENCLNGITWSGFFNGGYYRSNLNPFVQKMQLLWNLILTPPALYFTIILLGIAIAYIIWAFIM